MNSEEKQVDEELHLKYYNYAEVVLRRENVRKHNNKKIKRV